MEIPNNPTPHIHYGPVEPGTAAKPTLTDYTYGAEEDSRIFHGHPVISPQSWRSIKTFPKTRT